MLMTGGRGSIGSNLVMELESRGHEVWVCDLIHSDMQNYIPAMSASTGKLNYV